MIRVVAGFLMALCFGFIGFFDDYIKVIKKRNMGLNARQKIILQFLVAICYFVTIYLAGAKSITTIPFVGEVDFGISYWIMGVILIVGMVNAVNFTDGIDGLNSSVTFFVCVFFMVISSVINLMGASILAAACAGGCLGFLLWNFYPAKVFMGDVGSLFLGGIICALAFGINMPILLLPMGIVYIIEILSVVLQVIYFKSTKGKRLFKMSPIHHHFELSGFNEVRICALFSMIAAIGGVIAVLLVLFGL
jgi:phospho-N-acetylmuramoyl-pentapeptide-transferase